MAMSTPLLACAAVTLLSAAISLGFSVAAVRVASGRTRVLGLYACARSLAFVAIGVVPLLTGWVGWLCAVSTGMIVVQACDAVIGFTIGDRMKTFGPAGTAIANAIVLIWLLSSEGRFVSS